MNALVWLVVLTILLIAGTGSVIFLMGGFKVDTGEPPPPARHASEL
jgi:hypothetical protein